MNMGAGSDTALGGDGVERIIGGDGDDTVDLGGGDDTFQAGGIFIGDGDDIIDGGSGLDTYDATSVSVAVIVDLDDGLASSLGAGVGVQKDSLESIENATGSAFADTLTGDDFANVLKGLAGSDILTGAAGRDTLQGDDGADLLIGGLGRDLLYGGGFDGDVDIFDFNNVAESGITGATRDRIVDFEDGFDKIDVSTIDAKTFLKGNQAFGFIGAGAFTSAGGQIRAFVTAAGNTVIEFNTDHDKAAEMSLVVLGTPTLSGADFVL
jgi:Ca2+-binding RTX toxin-like protein